MEKDELGHDSNSKAKPITDVGNGIISQVPQSPKNLGFEFKQGLRHFWNGVGESGES